VILENQNMANYFVLRVLIESIDGVTDVFVSEDALLKNQVLIYNIPNMPPVMITEMETNENMKFVNTKI